VAWRARFVLHYYLLLYVFGFCYFSRNLCTSRKSVASLQLPLPAVQCNIPARRKRKATSCTSRGSRRSTFLYVVGSTEGGAASLLTRNLVLVAYYVFVLVSSSALELAFFFLDIELYSTLAPTPNCSCFRGHVR
jgi:hypothetical protein